MEFWGNNILLLYLCIYLLRGASVAESSVAKSKKTMLWQQKDCLVMTLSLIVTLANPHDGSCDPNWPSKHEFIRK